MEDEPYGHRSAIERLRAFKEGRAVRLFLLGGHVIKGGIFHTSQRDIIRLLDEDSEHHIPVGSIVSVSEMTAGSRDEPLYTTRTYDGVFRYWTIDQIMQYVESDQARLDREANQGLRPGDDQPESIGQG